MHQALPVQVIYLVRDVWRGLSAKGDGHVLPGGDKGFQRSLKDLTLTRCLPACCLVPYPQGIYVFGWPCIDEQGLWESLEPVLLGM